MKKFLLLGVATIFLPLCVSAKTKLDTIDYWHVSYNNRIIEKFNQNSPRHLIVIKKNNVKPADVLSIDYGNDTPCHDCTTGLYIRGKSSKIKLTEAQGTFTTLKIPLKKLIEVSKNLNKSVIEIYYFDKSRDVLLFNLKLD